MVTYRIGAPFWKVIYKLTNCELWYRYQINKSAESGDFLLTSPDIKGLFMENATIEALLEEINDVVLDLVEYELYGNITSSNDSVNIKKTNLQIGV